MHKANELPVMIELLIKEYINEEFQAQHRLVTETLPTVDASLGFEGLPEPLRAAAYRTAWYYNATGGLIALGTVEEHMFVRGINYRVRNAWSAMEAHILAERDLRGQPFLDGFEHLAARCFANDPKVLQSRFEKVLSHREEGQPRASEFGRRLGINVVASRSCPTIQSRRLTGDMRSCGGSVSLNAA
nr:hypothetical protein GCM10020092_088480 [Actinoplanes digitatis]